jgi:hypothetical protein
LKAKVCGGRTCNPNSPGHVANTYVIESAQGRTVNDVNFGSDGRFCCHTGVAKVIETPAKKSPDYKSTFFPFFLLHFKQVSRMLCSSDVPPRARGMT